METMKLWWMQKRACLYSIVLYTNFSMFKTHSKIYAIDSMSERTPTMAMYTPWQWGRAKISSLWPRITEFESWDKHLSPSCDSQFWSGLWTTAKMPSWKTLMNVINKSIMSDSVLAIPQPQLHSCYRRASQILSRQYHVSGARSILTPNAKTRVQSCSFL